MIEISLQELNQLMDVHSLLNHPELVLQASVFSRLLKCKKSISIFDHPKECWVNSRPLFDVRLTQDLAPGYYRLGLISHFLLEKIHSLLLFV
jgi:hypothetical protein